MDRGGRIAARREFETGLIESPEDAIVRVSDLLQSVAAESNVDPVAACLGTPGLVDAVRGVVVLSANLPGFRNLQLASAVEARLGIPSFAENDANVAALGEFRYGAGRGFRHLLHATLGTGIGGGLVIDGRLYRGAWGLAGEIGHVVIDQSGPRCNCGSRGCLEALVGGAAFARRAQRLLDRQSSPILAQLVAARAPTSSDLFKASEMGCAAATAEIQNGAHLLGITLGGFVNVLNPDVVTLSGGLLRMGELFLEPMRAALRSIAYGPASGTKLMTSTLGDDAGLLGAAAVAQERLEIAS